MFRRGDTMTRFEARQICMTCLYQKDILKQNSLPYDLEEILKENMEVKNNFVREVVYGVEKNQEEIDTLANKYLKNWDIKRLDKTGAAILRIAFYELLYMDTPEIVVINEAVELAKKYNDEELAKMINAALDKYIKDCL